jgi:hypothetical protein
VACHSGSRLFVPENLHTNIFPQDFIRDRRKSSGRIFFQGGDSALRSTIAVSTAVPDVEGGGPFLPKRQTAPKSSELHLRPNAQRNWNPMHATQDNTRRPSIDLTEVTESTCRALYDAVVEVHFSPTTDEVRRAAEDPDNHWAPDYGPDAAGLTVLWIYGRWIAAWRSLEEPEEAPAAVRWTVLRIDSDPEHGFGGLSFSEV